MNLPLEAEPAIYEKNCPNLGCFFHKDRSRINKRNKLTQVRQDYYQKPQK
jgi:hypothetical protein